METFFKNDFQSNLLSDRCAAFLLSQRQLEKEASGRQIISTSRHDKVCRNCFDHSPYDETEKTYQTKSLLSAVARRHGNAGRPSRSKSNLQLPQTCISLMYSGNKTRTKRMATAIQHWRQKQKKKKKYFNYFLHLLYVNKKVRSNNHRHSTPQEWVFFCVKGTCLCTSHTLSSSEVHQYVLIEPVKTPLGNCCLHTRRLDSAVF